MELKLGKLIDGELTEKVIGCGIEVQRRLGTGFLEKVYENALLVELRHAHLRAQPQVPLKVWYREECVGDYIADLIIEDRLILELKTAKAIDTAHVAQCINYLRTTRMPTALILNFGECPLGIKRLRV